MGIFKFLRNVPPPQTMAVRQVNEGVSLMNAGRREDALVEFDRALETSPTLEEAWYNKGNILQSFGKLE